MPRPTKCRRIQFEPDISYFKPAGIPLKELEEVILTFDELEAIRLKDLKGMTQDDASKAMGISQPTFHRLLASARKKVSEALVEGKAVRVSGGNYKMVRTKMRVFYCVDCENEWEESYGTRRPIKCPSCEGENIHRSSMDRGLDGGMGEDISEKKKRGVQT